MNNPNTDGEQEKLRQIVSLFEKYGQQYNINYMALAAQAYQESKVDHSKVSPAGAVGIMPVLPSAAADPNVNDIRCHPDRKQHSCRGQVPRFFDATLFQRRCHLRRRPSLFLMGRL